MNMSGLALDVERTLSALKITLKCDNIRNCD